ncbi:MAG: helix-turn-helix transcriptional regulator [Lachnospiraceae bacterium]|nr:helix-turn-helix transcriptional regulator [Lachnospiraceae bacterium]
MLASVSRRTVSRWETGSNLPELDILIEMADYYEVELPELLNGERKSGGMNRELEETVRKVAEYSNEDKLKITKRMHLLFIGGVKN